MILRKPDFYDKFKCTASKCSDTCCVGWEIDIDEASQEAYRKIAGIFGDKLRTNIEGGHFRLLSHDRCPFLDQNNLCEIYKNLGENSLCDICREHPRFVEVYGDIMERGLGLCCEEATRLLLEGKDPLTFTSEECDESEDELDENDIEIRNEVLYEREQMFKALADSNMPFGERLYTAFGYTNEKSFAPLENAQGLYKLLARTVSFGPTWDRALASIKTRIESAGSAPIEDQGYFTETESSRLLAYLVYRHFAKCLFEGRADGKRNFALFFWNAARFFTRELAGVTANNAVDGAHNSVLIKIDAIKILSRQLEYCEENMELIEKMLDDV
jgi:lysine-N-methylase